MEVHPTYHTPAWIVSICGTILLRREGQSRSALRISSDIDVLPGKAVAASALVGKVSDRVAVRRSRACCGATLLPG